MIYCRFLLSLFLREFYPRKPPKPPPPLFQWWFPFLFKGADIFSLKKTPWKKIHPPPGLFVPNEPWVKISLHQNPSKHPSEHLKLASHSRHRRGYLASRRRWTHGMDVADGACGWRLGWDGWLGSHLRGTGFFKADGWPGVFDKNVRGLAIFLPRLAFFLLYK